MARAKQAAMPVIGFAMVGSARAAHSALGAFEDGLKEIGYIAGQNVTIEYRFAEGNLTGFPISYPNSFAAKRLQS